MSFARMSLSTKLLVSFFVSVIITFIVGLIGLQAISGSNHKIEFLIGTEQQLLLHVEKLQILALQHRRYEKDFFLNIGNIEKQNTYLEKFGKASVKTKELFQTIEGELQAQDFPQEEIFTSMAKTTTSYDNYVGSFQKLATTVQQDATITPQQANKMMKPFKEAIYDFEKGCALLEQTAIQWSEEAGTSVINSGKRSWTLIAILLPIALILNVVFGIILSRLLSKPIIEASHFAKKMAGGDFTATLSTKLKDEIGVLIDALNHMSSNLQTTIQDIASGSQILSSTSFDLSTISNQMSTNAEQTTEKANAVAIAAEEMSGNMESVAAASEETSVNMNIIASATEEMTASISEIAENTTKTKSITGEAVIQSENASTQINELGTAAQEIGKVTETITDISEQTNLLALNATIEAARAGEAGKGFAVVANEIKDLAKQTSEATGEIKTKIARIQDASKSSVAEITQISEIIRKVNEMVSTVSLTIGQQSNATQEIADNVAQASQGIQEVNENVALVSSVAHSVASDISEVGKASGDINGISTHVNESAEELSKLAETLEGTVSQFSV